RPTGDISFRHAIKIVARGTGSYSGLLAHNTQSATGSSARMKNQREALMNANNVPVTMAAVQPKVAAVNGTSKALTKPAALPPVFITPQAAAAFRPPTPMPAAQNAASVTWLHRKLIARQATAT